MKEKTCKLYLSIRLAINEENPTGEIEVEELASETFDWFAKPRI